MPVTIKHLVQFHNWYYIINSIAYNSIVTKAPWHHPWFQEVFFNDFYFSHQHDTHNLKYNIVCLYIFTILLYNFIEQLGLILTIIDWMHFSKTFNAWYNVYMCIFAIVKYRSNIVGMSDGVPRMISVLLKFIFVSVSIEIQALTLDSRKL